MPLKTIARRKFTLDAAQLGQIMRDYDVKGLVVGLPLLLDGREGRRCQSVRDFTAELDRSLTAAGQGVPITFWDERFSTYAGDAQIDEIGRTAGKSVRGRYDQMIDSLAAQQILRDFIGG